MSRFGGNEFLNYSIPVVFEGRYFILEPGDISTISVVVEKDGKPVFEILKNEPVTNELTNVSKTSVGIITVSDKRTDKFLYKVRPASETSVVFGKIDGTEISINISDKKILVGSNSFENNTFYGNIAGIVVYPDGNIMVGTSIPKKILNWFI